MLVNKPHNQEHISYSIIHVLRVSSQYLLEGRHMSQVRETFKKKR